MVLYVEFLKLNYLQIYIYIDSHVSVKTVKIVCLENLDVNGIGVLVSRKNTDVNTVGVFTQTHSSAVGGELGEKADRHISQNTGILWQRNCQTRYCMAGTVQSCPTIIFIVISLLVGVCLTLCPSV